MKTIERDTIDEIYEVKKAISASFATYDQFAAWLIAEQDKAKARGVKFTSA